MILNINSRVIPDQIKPLIKRIFSAGFVKANFEYESTQSALLEYGITIDELKQGVSAGISFSSSEKGKEDWISAGLLNMLSHDDSSDPVVRFTLNFNLQADN